MKKLLFVIFLSISSVVHANWKLISTNDVDDKFYVDTTTIQTINNYKRAWIKSEYVETTTTMMRSARAYEEFDCKERKTRMLSFEPFKKPNLVDSFGVNNKTQEWFFVAPGSSRSTLLLFVCKQ